MAVSVRSKYINMRYDWHTTFQDMKYFINRITYVDDIDKADDIEVTLIDEKRKKWFNIPKIKLGNTLTVTVHLRNWLRTNDTQKIPLGKFYVDSFSLENPLVVFKGVSLPVDSDFKTRKRNEVIKKSTLKAVAGEIASKYKLKLIYHADTINLKNIERQKQSDSEFLSSLCNDYGLKMKIFSNRLIIFDIGKYAKKKHTTTLKEINVHNIKFTQSVQGTYTACEFVAIGDNNKPIKVKVGKGKRCLHIEGKAYSVADAKAQAKNRMLAENLKEKTLSFTTIANSKIFAGCNIKIKGLGLMDGKWFVTRVVHELSTDAYVYNVQCSMID